MKGRGSKKRSKSWFKPGHQSVRSCNVAENNSVSHEDAKLYQRLTQDEYDSLVEANDVDGTPVNVIRNEAGIDVSGRILRPQKPSDDRDDILNDIDQVDIGGYRLVHQELTRKLWNTAIKEHKNCDGELYWNLDKEQKWGLCWIESLICYMCNYETKLTKLYEERHVPHRRGRKAGIPNVGLQVGLTHTPMANSGFQTVCAAIGVPPPASSSMQKAANIIAPQLQQVNEMDMARRTAEVKRLSDMKGNSGIWAETDASYSTPLQFGVGRTPGQPACQVVAPLIENVTPKKQILSTYLGNKHCATAKHLLAKGIHVKCPHHKGHCSANIDSTAIIGDEHRNTKIMYQAMVNSGVTISCITTDGDSKSGEAITEINKSMGLPAPIRQRDSVHLRKTHAKHISKQPFSMDMFGAKTKSDRDTRLRAFARDISRRCDREMAAARKKFHNDAEKMEDHLENTIDAIIDCYNDNCGDTCRRYSLVCTETQKWQPVQHVIMDSNDAPLLLRCLEYRLGHDGVVKTRLGTSTQKSESHNRSLRCSLPKNTLFMRNAIGRVHSTAHRLNNDLGQSLALQLAKVGADMRMYKRILMALRSKQHKIKYDKLRQQTDKYKQRRCYHRVRRYAMFDNRKSEQSKAISYTKGIMDPMEMRASVSGIQNMHSYSKNLSNVTKNIDFDHTY